MKLSYPDYLIEEIAKGKLNARDLLIYTEVNNGLKHPDIIAKYKIPRTTYFNSLRRLNGYDVFDKVDFWE